MPPRPLRHTKIIITLGPATESEAMLEQLIRGGVDVVRLNMAHASHDWIRASIRRAISSCGSIVSARLASR